MSPEEKIEAAQKLIDEARAEFAAKKRNWPEKIDAGMLFRSNGKVVAIPPRHPVDHAISLDPERIGMSCYGWENAPDIEYLGHARDLIKIADDAHEPTGAELVPLTLEWCDEAWWACPRNMTTAEAVKWVIEADRARHAR